MFSNLLTINLIAYIYPMPAKKKRKSSCPFAGVNRTDVLETNCSDQEQNRWENDTVSASWAQTEGKGKDEPAEPDSQESWQKLADQTTIAGICLQENLLKSVSCQFCHTHVTLLENVSERSGLRSCWIMSCQNEDCLSRTVHFSNHKSIGAFTFQSRNFLFDFCRHTSPKVSLVYANAFFLSSASLKLFR